jgi:serine/threonine-protein kinase
MIKCPQCLHQNPDDGRFCNSCGTELPPSSLTPTEEAAQLRKNHKEDFKNDSEGDHKEERKKREWSSSEDSRFLPGMKLAERYRIVSLLGKGGMGEVYRADDLKLGQQVALKFLPEELEEDESLLNRLLSEVKIARQVSHPNVCRVYDIGEVEGQHFLSMEYVDGENLASLLKQVGRFPKDKAVQIARQLCAGLAAAHDQGILHRDLKPSNVMIDGKGNARITDFGLAALEESIEGKEVRSGTPTYMAPEQLTGKGVTVKSDLYSLGLVLYELFTGKRAFTAYTPTEMAKQQTETTPVSPSTLIDDIDPAVERVILRCLEKDPANRPKSALAIAAALPGGDPLAEALAAGETPAPELVAATGGEGALKPAIAILFLILVLAGIVLQAFLFEKYSLLGYSPLEKSPEILVDRAHQIIEKIGYTDPPVDSTYRFNSNGSYLEDIKDNDSSLNRWDRLSTDMPKPIYLWYRQSPRPMIPGNPWGMIHFRDPDFNISGMINLQLDAAGRLFFFQAVPPQYDETEGPIEEPDWLSLFAEAGLEMNDFTETTSRWNPEVYADMRKSWVGTYPDQAKPEIRVEAASYKGKPVYFDVLHPWDQPRRLQPYQETTAEKTQNIIWGILLVLVIIGAFLTARRNLLLGRGDKKGAFRVALYVVCVIMLRWLFECNHVMDIQDELLQFMKVMGMALLFAGIAWMAYVALEPFIRRRWPESLVSWNRLLDGRFRDPLIGKHLLIGAFFGVIVGCVVFQLRNLAPGWLGYPPERPLSFTTDIFHSARGVAVSFFDGLFIVMYVPMIFLFLLILFRFVLRRWWIAIPVWILFFPLSYSINSDYFLIAFLFTILQYAIGVYVFLRLGIVAAMSLVFFSAIYQIFPLTLDFSTWYADATIVGFIISAAIAIYAFIISLGGQPLIKPKPEEP